MITFTMEDIRSIYGIETGQDSYLSQKLELANKSHATFYGSLDLTNQKRYMAILGDDHHHYKETLCTR